MIAAPLSFIKSLSIEAVPVGRKKQLVKCDVSGSSPIRLIVGSKRNLVKELADTHLPGQNEMMKEVLKRNF